MSGSAERPPESWSIPAPAFDAMVRRAEEDYPRETCGLVFSGEVGLEVVPLANMQDSLHAADPEAHPRDARTAYAFDPGMLAGAIEAREPRGLVIRAIYHSHPDHQAYFSKKDREEAVPPEWGEPAWPGIVYLVFSVYAGRLQAVKGFGWSGERRDFVEVAVSRQA